MTDWTVGVQIFYNGAYQFVTSDVNAATGVKVQRGLTDAGALRPSKINFRLNDPTDTYRPSNPASALWPQLKQYTKAAFATDGVVRSTGEVARWSPDQTDYLKVAGGTVVGGDRWVDVEVQGPLRRLNIWDDNQQSAMVHQLAGYANGRGYWPLEDGRDAAVLSNLAPAGKAGTNQGGSLQGADGPQGSDKVITVPSGAYIGGTFKSMPTSAGWQVHVTMNINPGDATRRPVFSWTTANGYRWQWTAANGTYGFQVFDQDGNTLRDDFYGFGTGAEPNQWITFRMKVSFSGATVTCEGGWYAQSADVLYGFTVTFSGTSSRPYDWRVDGNVSNAGGAYGHVLALYSTADDLQSPDFLAAFNGYDGELAADRFTRLMGQAGLPYRVRGTAALSQPMGPQAVDTLQNLLTEIMVTEDGLIFDRGDNLGIDFRLRNDMLNQTTALALTWPTNIAPPLAEVVDDLDSYNDVTVSDRGGGSSNATLETGAGSIADVGRIKKTVNVNVAIGTDLAPLAGYWLNRYTVPGSRYTPVTVDLDGDASSLHSDVNGVDIGDVITVAGRTPDTLRLQVTAIDESVMAGGKRRRVQFTVRPADLLYAAVYDASSSRYQALGHVISGGPFAAGVVSIKVKIDSAGADGLAWTHKDGNFDLRVRGERMTCTAVSAVVAGVQTLTVVRAVNGVAVALQNGDTVELADPVRYA